MNISKRRLKIIATADGHIERLDVKNIDKYIEYAKNAILFHQPELFIYAGDLCDSRNVRAESEEYAMLNKYVVEISKACDLNNVKFIYVKGTPSHDGDVVKRIIDINNLNIKYVDKPELMFHKGKSILLLPELYMPTIESFYSLVKDLLNSEHIDKVDICVFHAMMDFAIPQLKQIDSQFNQSRSIVIDTDRFMQTFVTQIAFGGHVHKSINLKNCYYLGRFINEKHQSLDSDLFGFKFIDIGDDDYGIENITNPHLLNYRFVTIRITSETKIDQIHEYITKLNVVNEDTVFKVIIDKNKESRQTFALWKKLYKPINVKRKFVVEDISELERDEVSKLESITIDKLDIKDMIREYYHNISGNKLDEETLNELFKEGK